MLINAIQLRELKEAYERLSVKQTKWGKLCDRIEKVRDFSGIGGGVSILLTGLLHELEWERMGWEPFMALFVIAGCLIVLAFLLSPVLWLVNLKYEKVSENWRRALKLRSYVQNSDSKIEMPLHEFLGMSGKYPSEMTIQEILKNEINEITQMG